MKKSFQILLKKVSILSAAFFLIFTISCSSPSSDSSSGDSGSESATATETPATPATTTPAPAPTPEPTPTLTPTPQPTPVVNYTITFVANNAAATGSTASITAAADSTVTLTANGFSLEGYNFTGWNTAANGSGTGYSNGASFKLTGNLTLYAQWLLATVPTYTISVTQAEHGIVTASQTVAPAGTEITITVSPDELYALDTITIKDAENNTVQTTVNSTNSNVYTFSMPEKDVSVTVNLKYIAHSITVTSVQNGSVEVNKTAAVPGDEITVTISPNQYYLIDSVLIKDSENNNIQTTQNQTNQNKYKFIMPDKNVSVIVNLRYIAHSVTISSVQNGNVVSNKDVAVEGETITLTLSPNNLYAVETISVRGANNSLINVTANQNNGNIYTFTMPDQDVTVYVTFANRVHSVTVSQTQNGTASVNKKSAVDGDVITISATPNDLFAVDSVTIIDSNHNPINYTSTQSGGNTYKFTMPTSDVTVSVNFKYIAHTITIATTQNGTLTASKNVAAAGQSIRVTLNPNQYYVLNSIAVIDSNNNNITLTGSNNSYNFTMPDSNVAISVTYKLISYKVSFVTDCSTQIPDQLIQRNGKASIVSLDDNTQCEGFLGWYKDTECTENNQFDFNTTITQDVVLYAKWEKFKVNPDNIVSRINSLNYSCIIQGTGTFYGTNVGKVNTALQNLYISNQSLFVILDFSLATSVSFTADNNFKDCKNLKAILLPDNINSIANNSFKGCISLEHVTIPTSVTSIGQSAFYGCCSLIDVVIDGNIEIINNYTFCNCSSMKSITIPESVKTIGDGVFKGCNSLESIIISENVTSIGQYAFEDCKSLTNIIIPENVNTIKGNAFKGCETLEKVKVYAKELSLSGGLPFADCSKLEEVEFCEGVTVIPRNIFKGCTSLKTVKLSESITTIADSAFEGCSSFKSLVIPIGVVSIGQTAFGNCSSLESITIPSNVKSIGNNIFSNCSLLKSVIVKEGVSSIPISAFLNCSLLSEVTLEGNSITTIDTNAFYGCTSLTEITIPSSVNKIGKYAFYELTKITNIYFEDQSSKWEARKTNSSEPIAIGVSNSKSAAMLLTKTYKDYEWTKKQE